MSSSLLHNCHYLIHVHIDSECFWYATDRHKRPMCERHVLLAEAVAFDDLRRVCDDVAYYYKPTEIFAVPCDNVRLTPAQKKLLRVS